MQATATVDPRDIQKLDKALKAVAATTRGGVDNAIRWGMILAAQSARKATPTAKNRKTKNITRASKKRRAEIDAPWWADYQMEFWKNNEKRTVFVRNKQWVDKLRTPKWKGAAKSAWWARLRQLRASVTVPTTQVHLAAVGRKRSYLSVKKEKGQIISATLINKISYISKIAPNSAAIGIQKAANSLNKRMQLRMDRKIKQAFRTGTRQLVRMG